jgi:hypothetical protein
MIFSFSYSNPNYQFNTLIINYLQINLFAHIYKLSNFGKCLPTCRHAKRELPVPGKKDSPFGFFCFDTKKNSA